MSSYSAYSSHHKQHAGNSSPTSSTRPTSPALPTRRQLSSASSTFSAHTGGGPPVYSVDYNNNVSDIKTNNYNNINDNIASTPVLPGAAFISPSASAHSLGSPTSTLQGTTAHHTSRGKSPTMSFSNVPLAEPTRWKSLRLKVMRMATVERLQLLWGLLALFGTMSWLALMPAYAFRSKYEVAFSDPAYTMFLVATVGTSLSAIWQSLCPFLIRQSQRALLPRVINHPATQTTTIAVSVILTLLNFLSWMVLAADSDRGARTDCIAGRLSHQPGYTAQCRGVNTAIVLDVIVFILWIPISVVIVCGTIERGLWWWGEDDGWAQGETIVGGSNMMSEEEFDMKIGMGGSKQIKRRQTVHPESFAQEQQQQQDRVMIQQPKPAFVTPIASQFRSSSALGMGRDGGHGGGAAEEGDDDEELGFTPSSYRKHHQQRQQQQRQQQETRRLNRRASNNSLSSRLSTFFGSGWANGAMPPTDGGEPQQPPMPEMPSQYRSENNTSSPALTKSRDLSGGHKSDHSGGGSGHNRSEARRTARKKEERAVDEEEASKKKKKKEEEDEADGQLPEPLHGDSYASQWHSRRYDDWS
ncbi:hypothetical protein BGZ70_002011 [Mortierella alpina]|uniref:Uncharacterized protein n=1 Tax=Mortierella alpina TaxID=64518 RepID=A0A9P6LX29_MORAP|nr:hypothetical protein BGZ70_002011 [Mortierella alpina]